MKPYREQETINLSKQVEAKVPGELKTVTIPAGSEVTIVHVYGDDKNPLAYEIEYYWASEDTFALATLDACDI